MCRVHDLKEATLCVEELKFPQFYPAMVSMWVSDSLDKRDAERDLLFKLLAHLHNSEPCVLTHDQITKGYDFDLSCHLLKEKFGACCY
jgi:translation initiation factor 4G